MGQSHHAPMTPAEFLAWEAKQDVKREFDGLRPVAMNRVSVADTIVQTNLYVAFGNRLRGFACRVLGPSLKVEIGRTDTGWSIEALNRTGTIRRPKISVESPAAELYGVMDVPPLQDVEER